MTKKILIALLLFLPATMLGQGHVLAPVNGGMGYSNTVGIKMGSVAWDLSALSAGFGYIGSGGALSTVSPSGTKCYPFSGSGGSGCDTPTGTFAFPGAGIANSTGSAWGTSYGTGSTIPFNFLNITRANIVSLWASGSCTGLLNSDGTCKSTNRAISFSFGTPGGSAISTGALGYVTVPFACTIAGWSIEVDAGTATVKFMKAASGTAIPTVGSNSINTSGVAISTGTVIQSTTLTDFTTTTVTAKDIIGVQLTAVSGVGYIDAQLECAQ